MKKRCKHLNSDIEEHRKTTFDYKVRDGNEEFLGTNEITGGEFVKYILFCNDCCKEITYRKSPPKWLLKAIHRAVDES